MKHICKFVRRARAAGPLASATGRGTPAEMRGLTTLLWAGAVLLSMVCPLLSGCSGPLEQQARTVRLAPVSPAYKLTKRLEGKVYILLAETSTGQEQHRYAVSDSLTRTLEESANGTTVSSLLDFASKSNKASVFNDNLEVLSFSDLANQLNENGISERLAKMREFYQENGMFRKSDLEFLAKEIGANYLILPCLIDIRRWGAGRLSMFGLKIVNTQVISSVVSMEIWDVRTGRKVFAATSDATIAGERVTEEPIALEEALERAWSGIIAELPGSNPPPRLLPARRKAGESPDAVSGAPDPMMAAAVTMPQDYGFSKKAKDNVLAK